MNLLVTGASGYVGGRLVPELLDAGHSVRCLARTPAKLRDFAWRPRVEVVAGNVADADSLARAFAGCEAAYFLVHSLGGDDFAERDRSAATTFAHAAGAAGLSRIVYLGGLGEDDDDLSPHLRSRHEVGRLLADGPVPVTELRAAVVIGSGSASFEMLRHLVEVLPAMICPRWVRTRCQPIAVRDVLHYLVKAVELDRDDDPPGPNGAGSRILEVGGPDIVTYEEMMRVYAEVARLPRRLVVPVPLLSPRLSSLWVGLVTPLPTPLARPLIDSLLNEVVVCDHAVDGLIPHEPLPYRAALEQALRRVEGLDVATTWAGAGLPGRTPADPLPTDPEWSGGIVLRDERTVSTPASPARVFATVSGIGGRRGWVVANPLWGIRGALDRVAGGVGLRRGRRHPDELRVGDAIDFWRVEAWEPPVMPPGDPDAIDRPADLTTEEGLLRLRAEMRLPGDAWLEWRLTPTPDGGTELSQRALFHPRGVWGRVYWYAMVPFHFVIFRPLLTRLVELAEAGSCGGGEAQATVR